MSEATRKYSLFPKTLGQCVEPLTRPVLKTQGLAGSCIIQEWANIIGPTLAQHCNPQKLHFPAGKKTNGTLTIAVKAGFSLEVQHMEPIIMERLALYFGYKAVSRITISSSFIPLPPSPAPFAAKRTLQDPCLQLMENVHDLELKAILTAFAHTLSPAPLNDCTTTQTGIKE